MSPSGRAQRYLEALPVRLRQCGLETAKDHRHQCDGKDRDRQLNVLSEARKVWFKLINLAVARIEPDTF
ncbi:hypothetical protein EVAR_48148_1 [Eumeta japonica]|uniref:Uncharacterized protein n=1 Tax=Eumeta variegata TaxID=151549 RepID=A0A4C1WPH3_EUMVA|nr:hypothetical protein EVAR_48148_1 [Eumeta japonica]